MSAEARPRLSRRRSASLLAERRGLADALAEEVEGRATGVPVADHLDLLEPRGMDEERALDPDAARDAADRDLSVQAAAAYSEHGALVRLEAFAVAFDDAHGQPDGVSGPHLGEVGLELFGGKRLQDVVHRHNGHAHGVIE